MKKLTHVISALVVFGACFGALTGCGGSNSTPPPIPLGYAQGNLPDDGYWICGLEIMIRRGNQSIPRVLVATGEGLSHVKQRIESSCRRLPGDRSCMAAVQNNQFQCARAQNTGGMNEYQGPTTCRMPYNYAIGNGTYRSGALVSRGQNQEMAVRMIFNRCIATGHSVACTDAILSNAMVCRPMN